MAPQKKSIDEIWKELNAKAAPQRQWIRQPATSAVGGLPQVSVPKSKQRNLQDIQSNSDQVVELRKPAVQYNPETLGVASSDFQTCIGSMQRSINCLSDPDRSVRLKALVTIRDKLMSGDSTTPKASPQLLQAVACGPLLYPASQLLRDQAEKIRTTSLQFWTAVMQQVPAFTAILPVLVPEIVKRIGVLPVQEPSEEVRLQLVQLVELLLLRGEPRDLAGYAQELCNVLQQAQADNFHLIKKAGSSAICHCCKKLPTSALEGKVEKVAQAVVSNLQHGHWRVRCSALQALDALMLHGLPMSCVQNLVVPAVRPIAFDHSSNVRQQLFTALAGWLGYQQGEATSEASSGESGFGTSAPQNGMDACNVDSTQVSDQSAGACGKVARITLQAPLLLPILLLGLTDPQESIAQGTLQLVEGVGDAYMAAKQAAAGHPSAMQKPSMHVAMSAAASLSAHAATSAAASLSAHAATSAAASLSAHVASSAAGVSRQAVQAGITGAEQMAVDQSSGAAVDNQDAGPAAMEEDGRPQTSTQPSHRDDNQNIADQHAQATYQHAQVTEQPPQAGMQAGVHAADQQTAPLNRQAGEASTSVSGGDNHSAAGSGKAHGRTDSASGHVGEHIWVTDPSWFGFPYQRQLNAGCRQMAAELLPGLLQLVYTDLAEWTVALRGGAARCLHSCLVLAQQAARSHLPRLLPTLCSAVADSDADVAKRVVLCVHVLGTFTTPHDWLPVLLDMGSGSSTAGEPPVLYSETHRANTLVVLSGLLHAASKCGHALEDKLVRWLGEWLSQQAISEAAAAPAVWRQLLSVVVNTLGWLGNRCQLCSSSLFSILLHLSGSRAVVAGAVGASHASSVDAAMQQLAAHCGLHNVGKLAEQHAQGLMPSICHDAANWTAQSPSYLTFKALLKVCGPTTLARLLPAVAELLKSCLLDEERDANLRISMLQLIDELAEQDRLAPCFAGPASEAWLSQLLLPCVVWRAGKVAAAVRFAAITAMATLLSRGLATDEVLLKLLDNGMLPLLFQCLDEDWYSDVRKSACFLFQQLLEIVGPKLPSEHVRSIYPELLKRLDDSNNSVRIATCMSLVALAKCLTPAYCSTNTGYIAAGVIIHMDDSDGEVREAACAVLLALAAVKPAEVAAEVKKVEEQFRAVHYCTRVLEACGVAACS